MKNSFTMTKAAFGVMMLIMIMMTSCSKSKEEKLMDKIPADVDLIAVCDVKTLVESLDGTVNGSSIQISDDVTDILSNGEKKQLDEYLSNIEDSGIDAEVCAVFTNLKDDCLYYVFQIEDQKKFISLIQSYDFEEEDVEDGWTLYAHKGKYYGSYIRIKDSYAYYIPDVYEYDEYDAARNIKKMMRKAENNPFGKTNMSKYIAGGNAGGVSFRIPREVKKKLEESGVPSEFIKNDGYLCLRSTLNDNCARFVAKCFDKNGEEMKTEEFNKYCDVNATLNPEAMKYLHEDEFLLVGYSLKSVDWDKIEELMEDLMSSDEKAIWIVVKSYLEKIDGTIAFGVGLNGGISSIENIERAQNIDEEIPMTMVIETKQGKARSIVNDLRVLIDESGLPYEECADGLTIRVPGGARNTELMTWDVEAKDNYLVLSNRPIKQYSNAVLQDMSLKNKKSIAVLDMPKNNELLNDFGIEDHVKIVLSSDVKTKEVVMELEFGEPGKGGLLGKIIKTIENVEKTNMLY